MYVYPDTRLVYPLAISKLSADKTNEILVYVMGTSRYACANWANATIDRKQVTLKRGAPSGTNYEDLFKAATDKAKGRLFVTELSEAWTDVARPLAESEVLKQRTLVDALGKKCVVTRLRAIMSPEAMDRDVQLQPTPNLPEVSNQFELHVQAEAEGPPIRGYAFVALFVPGVILLAIAHGRRRVRLIGLVCVLLAVATISVF